MPRDKAGNVTGDEREAAKGKPAPFRANRKSNDHRDDLPQVVIGMAVTRDGIPVRIWCWPGSANDSALIRQVKDDMRDWTLSRVVWVADRGFTSPEPRSPTSSTCSPWAPLLAPPARSGSPPSSPGPSATCSPSSRSSRRRRSSRPPRPQPSDQYEHHRLVTRPVTTPACIHAGQTTDPGTIPDSHLRNSGQRGDALPAVLRVRDSTGPATMLGTAQI